MARLFQVCAVLAFVMPLASVQARWKSTYATAAPAIQAWFQEQRLSDETQKRLGVNFSSCCDAGDVYPTRFRVVQDGSKYGRDEWQYEKDGKWLSIPSDIIQRTETPTGEPVLFLYPYAGDGNRLTEGTPVCFKLPPSKG